ncbi:ribonuclease Y [Planctellipticum variicoloris]|uniref:ribonuclease Y n=1 Tax=Planctellipticum variicoloris TaxID=3064265 RepID=UPI0030133BB6|nr:ribonuclease Y [Planctomycetaceae bacterium SH412]
MGDLLGPLVGLVIGALAGFFAERVIRGAAYKSRDEILQQAERDAESVRKTGELQAKEEVLRRREAAEKELNATREELRNHERHLDKRESTLEEVQEDIAKKERMLETTQQKLTDRTRSIEAKEKELDRVLKQEQEQLYKIAGLDQKTATDMLLSQLERELKSETGALIMKRESELKQQSEKLAREIVGMAIQRYASAHTSETTVSTIDIPSDEMKGRIIGREGRNIRAFEKATGVDVIVDDTPGVVVVSAFDSVRRETARLALTKLIQDGRIHPTRIDEVVAETQKEMDSNIAKVGAEAAQEAGVPNLHEKIIELIGRLQFRTSYSQNVLRHSIEVAHLTGLMAEQLGLNGTLARRCGFLHDIGKAADHEMEGGHPAVGAELLKRYGEKAEVVHAALGHHDDIRVDYIYTVLVAAADACSASRPGARRESLEKYVRRLEELEALAVGFPGVDQAFAVQAGREIRVIVNPDQINDREAAKLARDLATAIEQNLTYPGEVKVSVLRETRVIEFAK